MTSNSLPSEINMDAVEKYVLTAYTCATSETNSDYLKCVNQNVIAGDTHNMSSTAGSCNRRLSSSSSGDSSRAPASVPRTMTEVEDAVVAMITAGRITAVKSDAVVEAELVFLRSKHLVTDVVAAASRPYLLLWRPPHPNAVVLVESRRVCCNFVAAVVARSQRQVGFQCLGRRRPPRRESFCRRRSETTGARRAVHPEPHRTVVGGGGGSEGVGGVPDAGWYPVGYGGTRR